MHRNFTLKPTNKSIIVKAPNKANNNRQRRIPMLPIQPNLNPHSQPMTSRYKQTQQPKPTYTTVDFEGPVKPAFIFLNYPGLLMKEEEKEILKYREVYYIRKQKPKQMQLKIKLNSEYYPFCKDDHIAYRYQQEHVIGKGSFGSVIQCFDYKLRRRVAIKLLNHKPKLHSQIMFELNLLKSLQVNGNQNFPNSGNMNLTTNDDNNFIIKYIESFEFRNFFCIVMELAGYDLYTYLQKQRFKGFSDKKLQMVAKDTGIALQFIHSKGIIHCDIKPENILFNNILMDKVKVIDFGCSCYAGKLMYSYIQSRYYRAPEVVFGFEYGKEIDMWSLGCVLIELVTGQPLFPAEDEAELMQMFVAVLGMPPKEMIQKAPRAHHYFDKQTGEILPHKNSKGKSYEPNSSSISNETKIADEDLIDLVQQCLKWEAKDRITAEQFLNHKWIIQEIIEEKPVRMRLK